jgi:hypothetical protein
MKIQNIIEFRHSLLALHKTLIDYQRHVYESQNSKISSPGEFLKLLTSHVDFLWLRQISELIVSIDELLESKVPMDQVKYTGLVKYSRELLLSNNQQNDFTKKYLLAISKDSQVALAHGKSTEILKNIPV